MFPPDTRPQKQAGPLVSFRTFDTNLTHVEGGFKPPGL